MGKEVEGVGGGLMDDTNDDFSGVGKFAEEGADLREGGREDGREGGREGGNQ